MKLKIIIGKDNKQIIKLFDDSTGSMNAANLDALSRVVLKIGEILIDSDTNVSYFDWSANDGSIVIDIGNAPNLIPGVFNSSITVYDASNPDGIQWFPIFKIEVL